MIAYGSQEYWNDRYSRIETPFDWMVSYDSLAPTLTPLLGSKDKLILIVGCGDAPFSADLFYVGGFHNQINVDYSEIVIERQRERFPGIDFRVMDCLDLYQIEDNSFDVVIDKSLIDTTMCYKEGVATTMKLYSELHRVLKPGGRLITISLHKEDEVLPFGLSNINCSFVASSCSLQSERQAGVFYAICVFDKMEGMDSFAKSDLIAQHPLQFFNSANSKTQALTESESFGKDTDDDSYHFGFANEDEMVFAFGLALEDTFG